jgi:carbohydrate-binding DOMON domain-containing protein
VEWDGSPALKLYKAGSSGWEAAGSLGQTAAANDTREFAIPLEALGALEAGDQIRFVIGVEPANQFLPALGPAQIIMPEVTTADVLLEVQDPQGDDNGPGTYTYPTNSAFLPDAYDLKSFTVAADENNLIFRFVFFGGIPNPWGSGNNLAIQTLDVYIDKDPGGKSGARLLLPGRNAALSSENGWEYAIWAEGWNPGIFAPDAATLEPKPVGGADLQILVDTAAQSVTLRIPRATFGDGDPSTWGYAAAVLGQDGFPATGVWRVRDVNPEAGEYRFGGAAADATHTRIIDLAWAEGAMPEQDEMLSNYTSSSASWDPLFCTNFLIKK